MKRYLAKVEGQAIDLDKLRILLENSNSSIVYKDGQYYISLNESSEYSNASDVYIYCRLLLQKLNKVAAFCIDSYSPVNLGGCVIELEDDRESVSIFVSPAKATFYALPPKIFIGGQEVGESKESKVDNLLEVAKQFKPIDDALHFFSEPTWINMYKVYEVISDDLGGEHKLKNVNWVDKSDIDRFTGTAQSRQLIGDDARHAKAKYIGPNKPMNIQEAKILIKTLMNAWIDSKHCV
jgi:hypothetical protein